MLCMGHSVHIINGQRKNSEALALFLHTLDSSSYLEKTDEGSSVYQVAQRDPGLTVNWFFDRLEIPDPLGNPHESHSRCRCRRQGCDGQQSEEVI